MHRIVLVFIAIVTVLISGCAAQSSVLLSQASRPKAISTVALAADHGNTPEMYGKLRQALIEQGMRVTNNLPAGTRQTTQADLIVNYLDSWRWDVANYLESVTVNLLDASSGEMIVSGRWTNNKTIHGFQSSQTVLNELVAEMVNKLKTAKIKE